MRSGPRFWSVSAFGLCASPTSRSCRSCQACWTRWLDLNGGTHAAEVWLAGDLVAAAAHVCAVYGVERDVGSGVGARAAGGGQFRVGALERPWTRAAAAASGHAHPGRRHVYRAGDSGSGAGAAAVVAAAVDRAARRFRLPWPSPGLGALAGA